MTLFLFIIILLLLFIGASLYLYFDKKLASTRQQLLFTSRKYKDLNDKFNSDSKSQNNIYIKYSNPTSETGITNDNVLVLLAPFHKAPLVNEIKKSLEVIILDQADVNNQSWYYIALPIHTNINSKGWIKKTDFNIILDNSSSIIRK
ncbi:hypothetical protein [Clostridium fallax]|uniref:Uncharacterized protein n=1 Tax=Clostridium fallax TaxID=1533 RepID=A0A1M4YTM5_9CLOT|nr:hypothetical protein [Clostridium fallax]SHF09199.1 hypothetical protein SAMN05443638_1326 [Clostridium fallax]SQB22184.1 Uncharacterised protein [Clostridium fallax]